MRPKGLTNGNIFVSVEVQRSEQKSNDRRAAREADAWPHDMALQKKVEEDIDIECNLAVLRRHLQSHEIIMLSFTSPCIHIIRPFFTCRLQSCQIQILSEESSLNIDRCNMNMPIHTRSTTWERRWKHSRTKSRDASCSILRVSLQLAALTFADG